MLSSPPRSNNHPVFFEGGAIAFGLSLRDAEQCFDVLRTVLTLWPFKASVEMIYLLPLIISFQQGNLRLLAALEGRSLDALQKEELRPLESWSVNFKDRPGSLGKPPTVRSVSVYSILNELFRLMEKSLQDATSVNSAAAQTRWLTDRLADELQREHGGRRRSGEALRTVLLNYPTLVQSAGRFKASPEQSAQ